MCPKTATLSAYFDEELSTAQGERVEGHLSCCPVCRATLDLFSAQRDVLRSDVPVIADDGHRLHHFWIRVSQARLGRFRGQRRLSIPVPVAAAALLALLAAIVMNFVDVGGGDFPELVVVDERPPAPTVVSLTVTPGELDDFLALLEGNQGFDGKLIHTLPVELPVARFGEPLIVRHASFEETP